jgi:hypothetical protein
MHDFPAGSEAPVVFAVVDGQFQILHGQAVTGNATETSKATFFAGQARKTPGTILLAWGHIHGTGLWAYPSVADTTIVENFASEMSQGFLDANPGMGNMVVLTDQYLWLYNRETQSWDYAEFSGGQ